MRKLVTPIIIIFTAVISVSISVVMGASNLRFKQSVSPTVLEPQEIDAPISIEVIPVTEVARVTCYNDFGTMASGRTTYPGAVAVSDRSIPLGSEIYVEGYGIMTVEDRTNIRFAKIKPMTIDIYMNISREECLIFGVKKLTYKLL
jgi:3D (Asp-Asp-Asp) domain-containing protein